MTNNTATNPNQLITDIINKAQRDATLDHTDPTRIYRLLPDYDAHNALVVSYRAAYFATIKTLQAADQADSLESYPYIRAYGRLLGSHERYIREQIETARAEGAPNDAAHKRSPYDREAPNTWVTFGELSPNLKAQLKAMAA